MFARINLSTGQIDGGILSTLPADLIGLSQASLEDISAAIDPAPDAYAGVGYWPANVATPDFDPLTQAIGDGFDMTVDTDARRVTATQKVRPLTPEEIEAAQPPVDPMAGFIPIWLLRQRAEKLGVFEGFASYIKQFPALDMKLSTLEGGMVDPAYPDLVAGLDDMGVPEEARAYLFADPSLGVPDVGNQP